jgi:transglutaminase-like putative cysteine protease
VVIPESAVDAFAPVNRMPSRDTALARWLAPEPLIQSRDPRIAAQARTIVGREMSAPRATKLLADWVHHHIRPDTATGAPSAVRALEHRRGDCNEAAVLFVALARASGIPARTMAGLLYANGRFYYHAWAEVRLRDWVSVDPLLGQYPADAAHVGFAAGGLARQVELVPLLGRLKLEVL